MGGLEGNERYQGFVILRHEQGIRDSNIDQVYFAPSQRASFENYPLAGESDACNRLVVARIWFNEPTDRLGLEREIFCNFHGPNSMPSAEEIRSVTPETIFED